MMKTDSAVIKSRISLIVNILIFIFSIYGVTNSAFRYLVTPRFVSDHIHWESFRMFTNLSNFTAAIASIISFTYLIRKRDFPYWLHILRFYASSVMFLTFGTMLFVLCPLSGEWYMMYEPSYLLFTHLLSPLLILIEFMYLGKRDKNINFKYLIFGVLPSASYSFIFYVLLSVAGTDSFAPYPFMEIHRNGPFLTMLYVAWIMGLETVFNSLLIYFHKYFAKKENSTENTQLNKNSNVS